MNSHLQQKDIVGIGLMVFPCTAVKHIRPGERYRRKGELTATDQQVSETARRRA